MIGRILRALALSIGLYVLLTGVHYGTLWGLDQLRQRMEARLEQRYGADAVDREPPYKPGERWVMALDIQPSPYWQEAVGMSAGLTLPVALLMGLMARRRPNGQVPNLPLLLLVAVGANIGMLWLMTRLGGLALAGYLVNNATAAGVGGLAIGLLQGLLGGLILKTKDGKNGR
jgi:hypothetical protein